MSEVNSKNNTKRNCWYPFPLVSTLKWTTILTVWIVEFKLEHRTGAEEKRLFESILELEEVLGKNFDNSTQNWNRWWMNNVKIEPVKVAWTGEAISGERKLWPLDGTGFVSRW